MASLTVQPMVDAGTKPNMALDTLATTNNRVDVGSGTNTFLRVTNTSGSTVLFTLLGAGNTSYGVAKPSNAITIAITTGEAWVPLRKEYDQGDGLGANFSLATVTGIQAALVRFA